MMPESAACVEVRHTQIIACAGSGKTETMARRVAQLVADGVSPAAIVAFTFTERAAAELKNRIAQRVAEKLGKDALGPLSPMFVGTIHGYAFRMLQTHVPKYGNYDVLDDHRHVGLISREYRRLSLDKLGSKKHWKPVRDFIRTADIITNELIDPARLSPQPLADAYAAYVDMLDRFRVLPFGQLIARAVLHLDQPDVFERVHGPLRYLFVDEYQDINPAQERLIQRLAQSPVSLTVVGDDDQSIYQWRGADVSNILKFADRHGSTNQETLTVNRRSRPAIIQKANAFAASIRPRIQKSMDTHRGAAQVEIVPWRAANPDDEAEQIASTIERLNRDGFAYRDIAVLFRSVRTSGPPLTAALSRRRIPFRAAGRTGLFLHPEPAAFAQIHAWFVGGDWKDGRFDTPVPVSIDPVVGTLESLFGNGQPLPWLRQYLEDWKADRLGGKRPINLVGDYYRALSRLGVGGIDPDTPLGSARLGGLARFAQVLADFEHVNRRGRWVTEDGARRFVGGPDRGRTYAQSLYNYLLHYANEAYEEFEGEESPETDAVDILTIHQSKGLEWPVVFMPSLVEGRVPSRYAGRPQGWLLAEDVFPPSVRSRYEGSETEERRLFYVALTRARDCVYLSHFERKTNQFKPSPFLTELVGQAVPVPALPRPTPAPKSATPHDQPLSLSFSEIAVFDECGYRYRLASVFNFQQALAVELGYGKALHHVLRLVAEHVLTHGRPPDAGAVRAILDDEFYLPFANAPTFERMRRSAERLVHQYLADHPGDLKQIWATERPFELHLEGGSITGRADVILRHEMGQDSLAIVDYKASVDARAEAQYALQLAVYAAAGRREGLEVAAAFVHDLALGQRTEVDVTAETSAAAVARIEESIAGIRTRRFEASPDESRCTACDYRKVCRSADSSCRGLDG